MGGADIKVSPGRVAGSGMNGKDETQGNHLALRCLVKGNKGAEYSWALFSFIQGEL